MKFEFLRKDLLFSVSILLNLQLIVSLNLEYMLIYMNCIKKHSKIFMNKWENYALEANTNVIEEIKKYEPVKK